MDGAVKAMSVAVGILTTAIILSISFYVVTVGKQNYLIQHERSNSELQKVAAPYWQKYTDSIVKGSTIHFLQLKDDVFISVVTKESLIPFIDFIQIKDPQSKQYVDPADDFICHAIYRNDGVIVGLKFIEVGARKDVPNITIKQYLQAEKLKLQEEINQLEVN